MPVSPRADKILRCKQPPHWRSARCCDGLLNARAREATRMPKRPPSVRNSLKTAKQQVVFRAAPCASLQTARNVKTRGAA